MSASGYPDPDAGSSAAGGGPYHGHNSYAAPEQTSEGATLMQELQRANQQELAGNGTGQHQDVNGHAQQAGMMAHSGSPVHYNPHGHPVDPNGHPIFEAYEPQDPGSEARKRSKVSRACDECRRKKIRCDANPEGERELEACSSCKRSQIACRFSRQPMKRGPSKGYIKELADRVAHLEALGKSGVPVDGVPFAQALEGLTQEFQPLGELTRASRKRSHDISEGFPPVQPPPPQEKSGAPQHVSFSPPRQASFLHPGNGTVLVWDPSLVQEAYHIFEDFLGFLPYNIDKLHDGLARVEPPLQEAFFVALDCAVRSSPASGLSLKPNHQQLLDRADELIARCEKEIRDRTNAPLIIVSLIFLETLILMAIDAVNHRSTFHNYIDRAISYARRMKLHVVPNMSWIRDTTTHIDADEKLHRRVLLALLVLERFDTISTSSPTGLSDEVAVLLAEDLKYLAPSEFHLSRIAVTLGHISSVLTITSAPAQPGTNEAYRDLASNPLTKVTRLSIDGEALRIRENVEDKSPVVLAACAFARLMIARIDPNTTILERKELSEELVMQISDFKTFSILTHHFAALAAVVLSECLKEPETRDESARILDQLDDAIMRLAPHPSESFAGLLRQFIMKKRAGEAIDGVDAVAAQLATGDAVVTTGYLNVLKSELSA